MHKPNSHQSGLNASHVARVSLSLGLLLGAAVLAACESPLQQSYADRSTSKYADSLVARAIMDNTYRGEMLSATTADGGVRELARVDSPGPAAGDAAVTPAAAGAPTTAPATEPSNQVKQNDVPPPPSKTGDSADIMFLGENAAKLNASENQLNLSLQDAIARALKNALSIKVESYNPAIKETAIIQAQAAFDPILFGQSSWQNLDDPINQFTPNLNNGTQFGNSIGVKSLLPTGAQVQAQTSVTYHDIPNSDGLVPFSHSYAANIGLSVTQPLLKGFGTDVNEANIYLAQRDHRISLATFRRQVITTVESVEEAYDNLLLAKANVYVQERLLQATLDTQKRIKARADVDADKIQISQVEAAVQSRSADLIRARAQHRNTSDQLKTAINDPEIDIRQNLLINPTDKPISEPIAFNLGEQIDIALRQRTELQEARLQIERADIVLKVAKNALLPKADLTLSVQSSGLDDSFDSAWGGTINAAKFLDYGAGLKVEIPFGNREAEAGKRQTELQREQVIVQMVRVAQQIVLDVKLQLRDVLSSYQEIQARSRSRVSAADQLHAFIQKEEIVNLTPEFLNLKLQAQSQLAQAELAEIQSVIQYNLAIAKLEQSKGTLLEYNRISLDKAPPVSNKDDLGKIRFLGHTYDVK